MSKIGTTELIVILAIALLIFGPTVLPKFGKAMGKTIAGFKKGIEDDSDINDEGEKVAEEKKTKSSKKSKTVETEEKPKKKAKVVEEVEENEEDDDDTVDEEE